MATYGWATSSSNYRGHPALYVNQPYVVDTIIDFDSTTNAASDVFQAIPVPAKTLILEAGIEVLTADSAGNSGTVALGDGTNTWVAAAAPTSLGFMTIGSVESKGKTSLDTIDVTVGTGEINAKIRVWAVLCNVDRPETSQVVTFATTTTI